MTDDAATSFEAQRAPLIRVAYRMLGSMADAEDILQEAFIRWAEMDRDAVRVPAAFLRRMVTRLCLDHLKSARVRQEGYVGPWLPEPIVETELVEDVTLPLMLALDCLSPLERAAFLLHDVFGESFDDIGRSIGRDAAACRQLAARAREHDAASGRDFRSNATMGWRSLRHSMKRLALAMPEGLARSLPTMSAFILMAAANVQPRVVFLMARPRLYVDCRRSSGCGTVTRNLSNAPS